jgi:uncharacterized membrane protein
MLGHPLHPALVHFPIALLLSATFADVAWVAGLTSDVHVGAVLMAGGLTMGLVAMGAGMVDFTRLNAAVVPHALRHMAVVGTAWLGYAIALYLRRDALFDGATLGSVSVGLSLISALLLALGGWLGGRLVYTFGAGVRLRPASAPADRP